MTSHTAWFSRFAGHRTATLMDRRNQATAAAVQSDYPRQPAKCLCDDHGYCPDHRWTDTNPQ